MEFGVMEIPFDGFFFERESQNIYLRKSQILSKIIGKENSKARDLLVIKK
jgi:hypothetical protein